MCNRWTWIVGRKVHVVFYVKHTYSTLTLQLINIKVHVVFMILQEEKQAEKISER